MTTGSDSELELENDRFRVTKWTINPGGAIRRIGTHYEHAVVPLVTDTMYVVTAGRRREIAAELVVGQSYSRPRTPSTPSRIVVTAIRSSSSKSSDFLTIAAARLAATSAQWPTSMTTRVGPDSARIS